ncbi:hypothetical protein U0033_13470 [Chitinophaga sancti]|nr:hypothetical protein [Chitinophaga sancti]WQD65405.1 hypothetical protein U0033_13470 [Chitinophaga sancti]SFW87380.1 hypothetical protein SAMN05661012_06067 [Chitinophaga sancti]
MEALKERSTVEELAKKYDLHPTQINTWNREAAAKLATYSNLIIGRGLFEDRIVEMQQLMKLIPEILKRRGK